MTKNERFTLSMLTCNYPYKKTFEEILQLVENESEDVTIWQPFEDYRGEAMAEELQSFLDSMDIEYPEGKIIESEG